MIFQENCLIMVLFRENPEIKNKINFSESAFETFLVKLKEIRKKIVEKKILEKKIAHKLLLMSIFVKYFEDRKDREGNSVFPSEFFRQFDGADNFLEVLSKKGICLKLFDYLSSHFNGEIFKWDNLKEREQLSETDLCPLVNILDSEIMAGGQLAIWRLYSFNDLPIELISNIYEEFLRGESERREEKRRDCLYTAISGQFSY